jgi:uncharacterized RDD family membrane protein YckC
MATRTCPNCGAPDYGSPFCVSCQKPFPRNDTAGRTAGSPPVFNGTAARPAGFFRRFWALFFDWILLSILGDVILVSYQLGLGKQERAMEMNLVMTITTAAAILYFTLLTGDGGQTLGKKILGIRVVRTDGSPVTYGRAFARSLGYLLSLFFGTFLGFLWALWDRRRQAWHDKIAGTVVVRI